MIIKVGGIWVGVKAIKNCKVFPNDNSAMKVVYLAIESASKKWAMPIHN